MFEISQNRGHETEDHKNGKPKLGRFFDRAGFDLIAYELGNADVSASRRKAGVLETMAGELERSTRNCVRNVRRNLANGVARVLVVGSTVAVKNAVVRKFARNLTPAERDKTIVTSLDELPSLSPEILNDPQPKEKHGTDTCTTSPNHRTN